MDAICNEIYRYVLARQKVDISAIIRDLGISEPVVSEYLRELVGKKMIFYDFIFQGKPRRIIKLFSSPLVGRK